MRPIVAIALLAAFLAHAEPRFRRFTTRTPQGRTDRGLLASLVAQFEAFPVGGAGATSACAGTTPTGVKGETLTFSRGSAATCTKSGLATTGIQTGDLVAVGTNVPRVERDSEGVLGLRVEAAATNILLRSAELQNAAWSDVGTPTVTNSELDPFGGSTANTVTDGSAVAFEGRSQTLTVTASAPYTISCYVRAGTISAATVQLDGTPCSSATLSATTWERIACTQASSSSTSIVAEVLVGSVAGDTGSVIFGGCQVEAGSYASSYIPTTTAAVTRAAEGVPSFAISPAVAAGTTGSFALSVQPIVSPTTGTWLSAPAVSGNPDMLGRFSGGLTSCYARSAGADLTVSGSWLTTSNRLVCTTERRTSLNATTATASPTTLFAGFSAIALGNATFAPMVPGIYSRICFDPAVGRCR